MKGVSDENIAFTIYSSPGDSGIGHHRLRRTDSSIDPLASLQAGDVKVILNIMDQNKTLYVLMMFTLDADKGFFDLMASTVEPSPPPWSDMLLIAEQQPGTSQNYNVNVEKGPIYMICPSGRWVH